MATNNSPIGVGILGLGRSGWGIHCRAIEAQPETFALKAVYDPIESRRQDAVERFGCANCSSREELLDRDDVEMVVVASPNAEHAPNAVEALLAGKHVLCEKPFGLTVNDVDRMIEASQLSGKVLQPFQQRRFEPHFQKVKEICDSGILGEIQMIRMCWNNFARRWDWQTTRMMKGGALNNNGPHPIDHAMELFGAANPKVWCEMRRCLCSGEAEDYLKIILSGDGRPTVEVELISCVAYTQDRWLICGTAGGLRGTTQHLEWKWVDWSAEEPRPLSLDPTPDRGYNREQLTWHTDSWDAPTAGDAGAGAAPSTGPIFQLYGSLYASIREDKPQVITPRQVRSRVVVMEKARAAAGIGFSAGPAGLG
jgi:scyllo-inositol 2-dehydrogenase (NADP+)